MNWQFGLPEYDKLVRLVNYIVSKTDMTDEEYTEKKLAIDNFLDELNDYVRGCIVWCILQPLQLHQRKFANDHRIAEHYIMGPEKDFSQVYNNLADHERFMTRFFWEILNNLEWRAKGHTNLIRDDAPTSTNSYPFGNNTEDNVSSADQRGITKVTMTALQNSAHKCNDILLKAIQEIGYNDGQLPSEVFKPLVPPSPKYRDLTDEELDHIMTSKPGDPNYKDSGTGWWSRALRGAKETTVQAGSSKATGTDLITATTTSRETTSTKMPNFTLHPHAMTNPVPRVPWPEHIDNLSPFFSLPTYLRQVNGYLNSVCARML